MCHLFHYVGTFSNPIPRAFTEQSPDGMELQLLVKQWWDRWDPDFSSSPRFQSLKLLRCSTVVVTDCVHVAKEYWYTMGCHNLALFRIVLLHGHPVVKERSIFKVFTVAVQAYLSSSLMRWPPSFSSSNQTSFPHSAESRRLVLKSGWLSRRTWDGILSKFILVTKVERVLEVFVQVE